MNKELKTISKTVIIVCLCVLSYKMGKGDPLIVDKPVYSTIYDKCICVYCAKIIEYDKVLYSIDTLITD